MTITSSTADRILQCARNLIIAGGYNGFSYADIAKVVGIRNASIHHHFPSKVVLVQSLVAGYREEVATGIASLEGSVSDPMEQLNAYASYWEACIADETSSFCVCALLASEMPNLPAEVVLEVRAHFRALSAWLASVLERGANLDKLMLASSATAEAEIVIATVHGAMLSARAYGEPQVFAAIVQPMLARLAKN